VYTQTGFVSELHGFHASASAQAGVDYGELYDLKNDPGESMNLQRCCGVDPDSWMVGLFATAIGD
jgi:hypothetical protein